MVQAVNQHGIWFVGHGCIPKSKDQVMMMADASHQAASYKHSNQQNSEEHIRIARPAQKLDQPIASDSSSNLNVAIMLDQTVWLAMTGARVAGTRTPVMAKHSTSKAAKQGSGNEHMSTEVILSKVWFSAQCLVTPSTMSVGDGAIIPKSVFSGARHQDTDCGMLDRPDRMDADVDVHSVGLGRGKVCWNGGWMSG
jgi:hypothetical protein